MRKNSPLRVAVLRHGFFPRDLRVYKEVQALAEAGCEVTVICLRKPGEKPVEEDGRVRVYRLPVARRRVSRARYIMEYALSMMLIGWTISRLAFRRRFDIVQVNTLPDFLVFAALVPRMLGASVMVDLHEPTLELYETKYGDKASRFVRRILVRIERQAIGFAHHAFTVNETIRQRFIDRGSAGGKISVIRNVPAEDIFAPAEDRKAGGSHFLVLTHGTLQSRYGQDILIRALVRLRESIPDIRLRIVGGGETEPGLRRLAHDLECSDAVEITGIVPIRKIRDHLIEADVGVVPLVKSPFSELCQPNKLFEYIALKVPVVAARVSAIEESFDETCVWFFEAGDEEDLIRVIRELYQNPVKRRIMTEHAYERYQRLRWNVAKREYLRVVERLAGRSFGVGET
jgi:glycosyltransferase involved in cell wall biosynthesis